MRRQALEKLILEQYQSMYRLAFTYVKNPNDASDVVQESVYKAIKKADAIHSEDAVRSWLGRIVINTSLDLLRAKKKLVDLDEAPEQSAPDVHLDYDLERALSTLNEREHAIVVLRFFEEYKIREIADLLQVNENTVKTTLYRTLKKLRITLSEGDTDELQHG